MRLAYIHTYIHIYKHNYIHTYVHMDIGVPHLGLSEVCSKCVQLSVLIDPF